MSAGVGAPAGTVIDKSTESENVVNDDERSVRLAEIMLSLLQVITLGRMILTEIPFPVTLPRIFTPESMNTIVQGFARCMMLLEEEPMKSMISAQLSFMIMIGLAKTLNAHDLVGIMATTHEEGDGHKIEEWRYRALELLIDDADATLHLVHEELNGDALD